MISFGERVNRPLRRLFGLADCLLDLRGLSSVRFREGGWRSWRRPMLSSLMLATGICLTRRAYADLGLSRSAASWAAFCVSTGSSVYCFLVLLLIWLLSSKRVWSWPDWNKLNQRETTWVMVFCLCLGRLGSCGLGPRTSRSKMKGSFQMGVGSNSEVCWRLLLEACLCASVQETSTE